VKTAALTPAAVRRRQRPLGCKPSVRQLAPLDHLGREVLQRGPGRASAGQSGEMEEIPAGSHQPGCERRLAHSRVRFHQEIPAAVRRHECVKLTGQPLAPGETIDVDRFENRGRVGCGVFDQHRRRRRRAGKALRCLLLARVRHVLHHCDGGPEHYQCRERGHCSHRLMRSDDGRDVPDRGGKNERHPGRDRSPHTANFRTFASGRGVVFRSRSTDCAFRSAVVGGAGCRSGSSERDCAPSPSVPVHPARGETGEPDLSHGNLCK
jgi:hypothetical protein